METRELPYLVSKLPGKVEPARFTLHPVELLRRACIIGSIAPADIVVSLATVSRTHAQIGYDGAAYWLQDLHSRNGTYVVRGRGAAPQRVGDRHALRSRDIIRLGPETDVFEFVDPEPTLAVPRPGGFWFGAGTLYWGDHAIKLPPRQLALLRYLRDHARVCTREECWRVLRGHDETYRYLPEADDKRLVEEVTRLRAAIYDQVAMLTDTVDPAGGREPRDQIVNQVFSVVPGIGYRWNL